HLGKAKLVSKLELTNQHDLELTFAAVRIGQDSNFFDQGQREVLRFVDKDHGERLQRRQRLQEFVEQEAQLGSGRAAQPACSQVFGRYHAEIGEDDLEQVLARGERIGHERTERLAIEILQNRAAQRRLAGADVTGDHAQAFASADSREQGVECRGVRTAVVEERRV